MLAKLRSSLAPTLLRTHQPLNIISTQRLAALTQMQMFEFGNLQQRINRRLRKYRQEKVTKESSFNKNEGKLPSFHFIMTSSECFLLKEDHCRPGRYRNPGCSSSDVQFQPRSAMQGSDLQGQRDFERTLVQGIS